MSSTLRRCRCASTTTSPASVARRRTATGSCCRRATGTRSSGGCATWPSPSGRRASCASRSRRWPTSTARISSSTATSAGTSDMRSPTRSATSGAGDSPSSGTPTCARWCSPSRRTGLAAWELDLLEAGGVDRDRVVVAHEPTAGRRLGQLVARVRDAGLRPSRDRQTYAEVGTGPRRAGLDRRAAAATVLLLAPARQAHLPQRGRGRGAVRRARLHGRPPRGPPAGGPGPDWCATPTSSRASRAAACSRSRSPAARSTWSSWARSPTPRATST